MKGCSHLNEKKTNDICKTSTSHVYYTCLLHMSTTHVLQNDITRYSMRTFDRILKGCSHLNEKKRNNICKTSTSTTYAHATSHVLHNSYYKDIYKKYFIGSGADGAGSAGTGTCGAHPH